MSQSTKLGESYFVDLLDPFYRQKDGLPKTQEARNSGNFLSNLTNLLPAAPYRPLERKPGKISN